MKKYMHEINFPVWLFHSKDAECKDTSFVGTENVKSHDRESEQ